MMLKLKVDGGGIWHFGWTPSFCLEEYWTSWFKVSLSCWFCLGHWLLFAQVLLLQICSDQCFFGFEY
jgi:hypothetical protein